MKNLLAYDMAALAICGIMWIATLFTTKAPNKYLVVITLLVVYLRMALIFHLGTYTRKTTLYDIIGVTLITLGSLLSVISKEKRLAIWRIIKCEGFYLSAYKIDEKADRMEIQHLNHNFHYMAGVSAYECLEHKLNQADNEQDQDDAVSATKEILNNPHCQN